MNNLIEMSSEMTMSTREIAEMLGARHADIVKSVCRLHDAGAICHDTTLPFREFKTVISHTPTLRPSSPRKELSGLLVSWRRRKLKIKWR